VFAEAERVANDVPAVAGRPQRLDLLEENLVGPSRGALAARREYAQAGGRRAGDHEPVLLHSGEPPERRFERGALHRPARLRRDRQHMADEAVRRDSSGTALGEKEQGLEGLALGGGIRNRSGCDRHPPSLSAAILFPAFGEDTALVRAVVVRLEDFARDFDHRRIQAATVSMGCMKTRWVPRPLATSVDPAAPLTLGGPGTRSSYTARISPRSGGGELLRARRSPRGAGDRAAGRGARGDCGRGVRLWATADKQQARPARFSACASEGLRGQPAAAGASLERSVPVLRGRAVKFPPIEKTPTMLSILTVTNRILRPSSEMLSRPGGDGACGSDTR
jgi:hypothetical protein